MIERPILFNSPMVRAIRENRKTQTRRTHGLDKINAEPDAWYCAWDKEGTFCFASKPGYSHELEDSQLIRCPYGVAGDRLWCRESHAIFCVAEDRPDAGVGYRADHPYNGDLSIGDGGYNFRSFEGASTVGEVALMVNSERWRPSIHMPRWASRDTLEVVSARPERLQDITEAGAKAEGCNPWPFNAEQPMTSGELGSDSPYRGGFAVLWDDINEGLTWFKNPWVWAVTFSRLGPGSPPQGVASRAGAASAASAFSKEKA